MPGPGEASLQLLARCRAGMRATLEATNDAILVIGSAERVIDFNGRFVTLWSLPTAVIDSHDEGRLLDWFARSFADPVAFRSRVRSINEHDGPSSDILTLLDGRTIERHSAAQIVAGATVGRVWSFVDLTDRLDAGQALRQEAELLTWLNRSGVVLGSSLEPQAVVEAATSASMAFSGARFGWFIPHPELTDPQLSPAFSALAGHSPAQSILKPASTEALAQATREWQQTFHCDDLERNEASRRVFGSPDAPDEAPGVRSLLVVPVVPRPGKPLGVLALEHEQAGRFPRRVHRLVRALASHAAVAIDNARLQAAVRKESNEKTLLSNLQKQSAARLQNLSRRLMQAEEEERKRLGRELHDSVGANLSALGMGLELLRKQLPADNGGPISRRLSDLNDIVDDTMSHVRAVLAELRPTALDELGLLPALRHQADVLTLRSGIRFEAAGSEPKPRLHPEVEIAFYRIAQEAWANAMKHSGASCVTSTIHQQGDCVTLTVEDDGAGFEPSELPAGTASLGLTTMRERADAIGATLEVRADVGAGVVVQISLVRERPAGAGP